MSNPSETGRFWSCPECNRHVPSRNSACMCGFDKTKIPVQMREVSSRRADPPRERSFLRGLLPVTVIAVLVAYIGYDKLGWGTAAPAVTDQEDAPDIDSLRDHLDVPGTTLTITNGQRPYQEPPVGWQQQERLRHLRFGPRHGHLRDGWGRVRQP